MIDELEKDIDANRYRFQNQDMTTSIESKGKRRRLEHTHDSDDARESKPPSP
jgi:hypothetical protein